MPCLGQIHHGVSQLSIHGLQLGDVLGHVNCLRSDENGMSTEEGRRCETMVVPSIFGMETAVEG